jgi:hypothetical protein
MRAYETEKHDVRIAIAVGATSQSLGWIGSEAGVFPKSVHMRLVHSRSNLCLFLGGDFLNRRGNCGLIVDL